jgi:hypothetical protein
MNVARLKFWAAISMITMATAAASAGFILAKVL